MISRDAALRIVVAAVGRIRDDLDAAEWADLDAAVRDAQVRPLAWARLWDRALPLTSQRRSVEAVLAPHVRLGFILGGNRSGKSEAAAQIGVAYALGSADPGVRDWASANSIDVSAIPARPCRVCVVALTSGDSMRYVRPKWARYLPHGSVWRNRDGLGETSVALPNGGVIVFKSADQGREGMQGDSFDLVVCDEEPRVPGVVDELRMRLVDRRGRMILAMTPLYGWTPLLRANVQAPAESTAIAWLHGTDNPHVPPDELAALLAAYGPHERAARERGEITALEGRVYSGFRRDLHLTDAEPAGPRYISADWGTTVPTAILIAAYDESTDTLVILDEVYRTQMSISARAAAIRDLEARHGVCDVRWGDPEDASTMRSLAIDHDIAMTSARKDVREGISAVATRLELDVLGRPHLLIHRRCVSLLREIDGYVWDEAKDSPRKVDDHAMDALRYLVVGVGRQYRMLSAMG